MSMFRTGNPVLKDSTFTRAASLTEGVMTLDCPVRSVHGWLRARLRA